MKYLGIYFIAVAAQGLFFAAVQMRSAKRNAARLFLSLTVLCFSVSLFESGLWWSGQMDYAVHFVAISEPLPFLFGPLVFLYFRASLTQYRFIRRELLHYVPAFVFFIYWSQFYFRSTAEKTAMMQGLIPFESLFLVYVSSLVTTTLKVASLFFYTFLIWRTFFKKSEALAEVRRWFMLAFSAFAFYALNFAAFHLLERIHLIGGCSDYGVAIAMSVFVYLFSWFGLVRPHVFDGYSVHESLRPVRFEKYRSSVLTPALENELAEKLETLMRTERLYRDESLRLDTLANRLGVSRNSVSQVINRSGMNFFQYVNHWRIEDAKRLLAARTKEELNIIEIAYEVGFSNKVSFNKFFKKSTGLTPTRYRHATDEKRQA